MPSNTANTVDPAPETRRGEAPTAYLKRVGERVRLGRARRGMSRKVLSQASGVSERYLAELERGAGNASLLVLRQVADALGLEVAQLVGDAPERPIDLTLALHQLERLSPADLAEARRLLAERFGTAKASHGRIALVGLRGAGKTTLGQRAAEALGVPFVELDREVERASGMELSEIFASHGQGMYRRLERQCLEAVIARFDRVVIATGGSLVTEPGHLRSAAVVLLRRVAERQAGGAHGPGAGPGRPAPHGRRPAGHGRPQGHPGEPHRTLRQGRHHGRHLRQERGGGAGAAAGRGVVRGRWVAASHRGLSTNG